MIRKNKTINTITGSGLISGIAGAVGSIINKAIDILPVEIHFPGYEYCGPGTDLEKRLSRGDSGINKLDAACKVHDIAYSNYKDNKNRSLADKALVERAWERVKASDSSLGEKAAAWAVTNIMKAKTAFGGGRIKNKVCKCKKSKNKPKKKKQSSKKVKRNIKKQKRSGKGLYLKPYMGSGNKKKQ